MAFFDRSAEEVTGDRKQDESGGVQDSYTFFKVKFKHLSSTSKGHFQDFPAPHCWGKIRIYRNIYTRDFFHLLFITIIYIVLRCKHLKLCFTIGKT